MTEAETAERMIRSLDGVKGVWIREITSSGFRVSRSRRPTWTLVVAIVAFPIGLLALRHTEESDGTVRLTTTPEGTTRVTISGDLGLDVWERLQRSINSYRRDRFESRE